MGWWENYTAWVKSTNAESDAKRDKQMKLDAARRGINVSMSLADLEAAWNSTPADVQADTEIRTAYDTRKKNLPIDEKSLSQKMSDLAAKAETGLLEIMNRGEAVPIEEAKAKALSILAADAAFNVSVGIAGVGVEMLGAGQIDTFTDFQKFLRARSGYGGPITMLMKAPVELGLINPLSKALHAQYRDEYLSGQVALMLATKGHITEEQMRKAYQYEGYPDWAIDAFVKDRWRELRLGEIAWALNDALIDEKWLDLKLQNALYAPEDRPIIIRMIQEKYLRSYRDRVATQLRNLYKEGYVTYADFSDGLKQLGIPDKVRNMLASEAQYLYRQDLNADLRATWLAAFKNDIINENVYRGNLGTIIKDPARVEAEINKAKAARKPEAVAPPKPQTQGIKISSKPSNAMIFLDDVDTGRLTPDTIETTAAAHTLTVSAEGYEDAVYQVTVEAGQFVEIYAVLVPLPEAAE